MSTTGCWAPAADVSPDLHPVAAPERSRSFVGPSPCVKLGWGASQSVLPTSSTIIRSARPPSPTGKGPTTPGPASAPTHHPGEPDNGARYAMIAYTMIADLTAWLPYVD